MSFKLRIKIINYVLLFIFIYLFIFASGKEEGLEKPPGCLRRSRQAHLGGSSRASRTHPSLFGDRPLHWLKKDGDDCGVRVRSTAHNQLRSWAWWIVIHPHCLHPVINQPFYLSLLSHIMCIILLVFHIPVLLPAFRNLGFVAPKIPNINPQCMVVHAVVKFKYLEDSWFEGWHFEIRGTSRKLKEYSVDAIANHPDSMHPFNHLKTVPNEPTHQVVVEKETRKTKKRAFLTENDIHTIEYWFQLGKIERLTQF